jgi:hypothetical protein
MKMKLEFYIFFKHLVEDSQLVRYARVYAQYFFLLLTELSCWYKNYLIQAALVLGESSL